MRNLPINKFTYFIYICNNLIISYTKINITVMIAKMCLAKLDLKKKFLYFIFEIFLSHIDFKNFTNFFIVKLIAVIYE